MHPLVCQIGPFSIFSYGLVLACAFLIASFLAGEKAKTIGIAPDFIFNLSLRALIFGIIGSRFLYVLFHIGYYLDNPGEVLQLWHGGLSWFGGFFLGIVVSVMYIRANKLSIYIVLDLLVPFLAIGQSIGRIGCFLNGCCYGKPAGWGIYFPVHDQILIPVQAFSSFALIMIFVITRTFLDRPHKHGQILFTYLFLYSIKRFIIEFFRADNPIVIFGLTNFQIISLIIFIVALRKLFMLRNSLD